MSRRANTENTRTHAHLLASDRMLTPPTFFGEILWAVAQRGEVREDAGTQVRRLDTMAIDLESLCSWTPGTGGVRQGETRTYAVHYVLSEHVSYASGSKNQHALLETHHSCAEPTQGLDRAPRPPLLWQSPEQSANSHYNSPVVSRPGNKSRMAMVSPETGIGVACNLLGAARHTLSSASSTVVRLQDRR